MEGDCPKGLNFTTNNCVLEPRSLDECERCIRADMTEREVHDLVEVIGYPDSRPDYQRYLLEKALNRINPDWKEIHKKLGRDL